MAFISELIGRPVTDPEGEGVGTLQDLIARKTEYAHPVIQAIVIKRHGKNWIVPYLPAAFVTANSPSWWPIFNAPTDDRIMGTSMSCPNTLVLMSGVG